MRFPPPLSPFLAGLFALSCAHAVSRAELPSVRFDRLSPLGSAAGSSVEVEIVGNDIEEVKTLLFDQPGLKAEYVKEHRFRVTVAPDVPAGTYDVWLVGRFGVSNPRLFAVSQGLTEVAEKEPNDEQAAAQPVAVNSVVNGASDNNREDVFRFPMKQGQRVVIECQAGKLDSPLEATLVLTSADGRQLGSSGHYYGRDPLIDFVAPQAGDYFVSVHDLSFRGGYPYRLVISDLPQVENVFPRAVQAGKASALTAYGRNLGPAAKQSPWSIQNLPLEELAFSATPPADVLSLGAYRFFEHPTNHSPLPTAATCTLTGFQVRPTPGKVAANAIPVVVVDTPVTLEAEPNDEPAKAQLITLPAVVSGRFDRPRDADWYEFETAADGPHAFEVYSERIGGRADPYLVVVDDKGNRVGELDDYGHNLNAFNGHLRDPSGTVNLAAKKKYRVLVQDRYQRGGARFQYVLTVRKPVPDFYAAAIHYQNPGPGGLTVRRGGAAYLDVILHQHDSFSGAITISAEGLPPGLHAQPAVVYGNHGTFVLWADKDAAEWTGAVRLFATGKRGDETLRREVRPYTRVWSEANIATSRPMRSLPVAVRESAPFELHFVPERLEVEAGKKVELKLQVGRLWPDFKNGFKVLPLSFPGYFQMASSEIAADKSEAVLTVQVQPNAPPGEFALAVIGQAQVPFSKDPAAMMRPNTLVSQPSRPVTLVVPPKK